MKALLERLGLTYHKVKGLLWKGDPIRQREFLKKYFGQRSAAKRTNAQKTKFYFVDACHPVWGLGLIYSFWGPKGEEFFVGMGGGRSRYNILGAYNPDDHEYIDVRRSKSNINASEVIALLEKIGETHPETEKFYIYLDNAKYFKSHLVRDWNVKNPRFCLEPLPPYSPNLNLIERLWRFVKDKALKQFHETFESMQKAIDDVLDKLDQYEAEIETLMREKFHINDNVPGIYCTAA